MKLLIFLIAATLGAQTKDYNVNVRILGSLDTTGATATKPFRTVASDQSGSCSVPNEAVLNSQNGKVFVCSVSTWAQVSSSGSPSFDPQAANRIFAGPATGADAVPGFRALVLADMPASYLPNTRLINTASPLGGGGALTGDLTLTCSTCLVNDATYTNPAWLSTLASSKLTGAVAIANGGTGATTQAAGFDALAPTTTRGDIVYRGASNNVRLAVGSAGHFLTTNGTDPSWAAIGAGDLPDLSATYQPADADLTALAGISGVQGDLILRGGSSWGRLAIGASGRVLRSDGTTAAWSPISAADLPSALSSSTSINGLTVTGSTGTLTIANGKTATISNTLTFAGTDASSVAFGGGGNVAYTTGSYSDPAWIASLATAKLTGTVSNAQGGFGTAIGSLTGVLKLSSGTPSVVTGTSTNCVLVDGTSTACGGVTAGNGIEVSVGAVSYRGRLNNTRTSATVLTFGSDCSSSYPCVIAAAGSTMYPLTASFTVTISTGTGTLYIYKSSAGTTTVAKTTGDSMDPSCSGCTVGSAVTDFPSNSTPLYVCTATASATWDATPCVDRRATIGRAGKNIVCSTNTTCVEDATSVTISASGGGTFVSGILSRQGPNSNVTLTGGATYDTVFTYTLPANTLGANGCARVTMGARNSGAVTYRIGWGTATYDIGFGAAETYGARAEFIVCNTGATNTQSILFPNVAGMWYAFTSNAGPGFYPLTTATQDTTSTVAITLKANGTASDTVTPVWFLVNQL